MVNPVSFRAKITKLSKMKNWLKLPCKKCDLQLMGTLNGGQSFRWRNSEEDGVEQWVGVFDEKVWILQQNDEELLYKVIEKESRENLVVDIDYSRILSDYLRLDFDLKNYYKKWCEDDPVFARAAQQFYGIRILKQNFTENLFSFLCASNNNISRITSMVEKLALFYGEKICELNGETYYTFPSIESLSQNPDIEQKLRDNGFGYRSRFISESIKLIHKNGGEKWLNSVKSMDYSEAKTNLMLLPGIGAKIADCICLMSLGHLEALPVDTHVYQIALKFYMPHLTKKKTITDKVYNEIGDYFRNLYGPLAGWAHTILFCADLKKFQET